MRVPIAHALGYPERIASGVVDIDLSQFTLSFEPVDYRRYPCLQLAMAVANDNAKTTVLNAANEVAVAAFLVRRIGFMEIATVVERCLESVATDTINSIEEVLAVDTEAKRVTTQIIKP